MMDNISEIKSRIQGECADAWFANNFKGTFELATGVGKTFAALTSTLRYYNYIKENSTELNDRKLKLLILAEVKQREKTIMLDINKYNTIHGIYFEDFIEVEFACYQSAYKWENRHFDIVVADEIHDSLSMEYSKFYTNNTYNGIIGLSATIDRLAKVGEADESNITKGMLIDAIAPVVYKLKQSKAVEYGIIAPFELIVYFEQLDDVVKYVAAGSKKKPFTQTERAAYDYYDSQFKRALFIQDPKIKDFQIMNTTRRRANVLFKKRSKITVCRDILEQFKNKRTLVFGNDLDSLLQITPNVVCSRYTDKENKKIEEDFNNGLSNTIGSFKQLKQGANLSNINFAILHSYYSKQKDFIQRVGRIIRAEEGKTSLVIALCTSGTQEESWLNKMTQHSDITPTFVYGFENLIAILKEKL
jgi:superfamily II DNA or RNA helicase